MSLSKDDMSGYQVSLGADQVCWGSPGQVSLDILGSPSLVSCYPRPVQAPAAYRAQVSQGSPGDGSADRTLGLKKRIGKTQEKTYPLLLLFLLMKSRALPKPEGMEQRLSKTLLGKLSHCHRACPSAGRQGGCQAYNFSESWGQRPAGCCSSEPLFLERRK